jgi:TatD DNase family protein
MALTDTHAHLTLVSEELGLEALDSVLNGYARSWEEASDGRNPPLLLDPGVDPRDLGQRIELLRRGGELPLFIRLAAGIWPSAASLEAPDASLAALEASIAEASRSGARIAAIGECGLDYRHMEGGAEAQAYLFEAQIELASRLGLPIIVHSREAAADTLALVSRRSCPAIIHCFGYGPDEARAFLDAECWVSFAGNLTYKGSDPLREACALVPSDRLLLETDSPYMSPMPRRGKPATPFDIERTYALAASLRGVSALELSDTVSRNAQALFG